MMDNIIRVAALCLIMVAHSTSALEISLNPRHIEANPGELIKLDIVLDSPEVVLGGGWDVIYDPTALEFMDLTYGEMGDPLFNSSPTLLPGRLENMGTGIFTGMRQGVLATITFIVIGNDPTAIKLTATEGTAGPWLDAFGSVVLTPTWRNAVIIERGATYPSLRVSDQVTVTDITPGDTIFAEVFAFNDGTGDLEIANIILDQSDIGVFFVNDSNCTGKPIAPGGQCAVEVGFVAVDERPFEWSSVDVVFESNDLIPIRESARIRTQLLAPKFEQVVMQFYEAHVSGPFGRERAVMKNTGTWAADVERLQVTQYGGGPDEFFVLNDSCEGRNIPIGETCTIDFEFRPVDIGRSTGSFTMFYGQGTLKVRSNLRGSTPTGVPVVEYDGPNEIKTTVGEQTLRRVSVTNKGSVALTMDRDPIGNSFVNVLAANCAAQPIAPEGSCIIDLLILPTEPGSQLWTFYTHTDSFVSDVRIAIGVTATEAPPRRSAPTPIE